MDSHFNYTHWTSSSLPILADEWIDDQKLVEFIDLPEGTELPEDLEFNIDAITKFPLKDSKKNKKNGDEAGGTGPTGGGGGGGGGGSGGGGSVGNDKGSKFKPNLLEI